MLLSKLKDKLNNDGHLKDLLKGSAITFVLKMSGMGLGFILTYLISRRLGPDGVGFYNLMLQVLMVLGMVLGLGMNMAVLRYVGQFDNENDRPKMHNLYRYFVSTVGPLSVVVSVILYFAAGWVTSMIGKEPEYAQGLRWVAIVLPFFTINQISVEFIRGLKKLQISELVRSVLRPLVIILGILLVFQDSLSKMDVIYLLVIALVINSLVSRWAIWNSLRKVEKKQSDFNLKELLHTSFPMMITGVSLSLITATPIVFLDMYTTQSDVGVYSVAVRLAGLVSLVLVVVNTISAPKFAQLFWAKKRDELQRLINQASGIMFWTALFLCMVLMLGAEFWLGLFGAEFKRGKWVLIPLLLGQLANAATGSVGVMMNMSGYQKKLRNIIVFSSVTSVMMMIAIGTNINIVLTAIIFASVNAFISIYAAYVLFRIERIKTFYMPFLK